MRPPAADAHSGSKPRGDRREDAAAACTDARDGVTRYMTGPVKTWLKISKNRYGVQGAYLDLKHFKSETRFEAQEGSPQ